MASIPAVILAAGQSSRFWPLNSEHKSLLKIMGRPLIWYTLEGLRKAGIREAIIVQGARGDIEKNLRAVKIRGLKFRYAIQRQPMGTGDAIYRAKRFIKGPFIVTGAHKVDSSDYLPKILNKHRANPHKIILVGTKTDRPWDFGIFKFKGNKIFQIVENPKKGKEPSNVKSTEAYLFPEDFFKHYKRLSLKENNLIDTINLLLKKDDAELILLNKPSASLKYPWDLFSIFKLLIESGRLQGGVSDPSGIGRNVVIEKNVHIGRGTKILENAAIRGPVYIGNNCVIGNGVVVRPNTNIEDGALLGSFTEVKNSVLQEDIHMHSGYFGDSILGKGCRMGAGIVIANRRLDRKNVKVQVKGEKVDTGLDFLGAVIGEDVKIGIQSGLMPGVLLGSRCLIGPHSLVKSNVPDDTLFYSEFKTHQLKKVRR